MGVPLCRLQALRSTLTILFSLIQLKKEQAEAKEKDPTLAANTPQNLRIWVGLTDAPQETLHNNRPSMGALVDKEIEEDERAMLEKKKGKDMIGESYY